MEWQATRPRAISDKPLAISDYQVVEGRGHTTERILPPALWKLFTVLWLPFLIFPIRALSSLHLAPSRLSLTLTGTAMLVGGYLWLMLHNPFRDTALTQAELWVRLTVLATLTTIVLALTLMYTTDWLWFFIYATMAAGVSLPTRVATGMIAGLTLVAIGVGWLTAGSLIAARIALPVGVVGLGMIGVGRLIATIRELRAAREEIARLVVAEERLRFARDLHDLLGRSLSTITLKNELARRLVLEAPERAAHELDEALVLARDALREVRVAVRGYRQPTLVSEIRSAREILELAGIACQYEDTAGPVPPAVEAVLAWAMREGITNVVRHSRAHHCTIRVRRVAGTASIEVLDDGQGVVTSSSTVERLTDIGSNGLRGVAERVARLRGYVEAGPRATTGFRFYVALPTGVDSSGRDAS